MIEREREREQLQYKNIWHTGVSYGLFVEVVDL